MQHFKFVNWWFRFLLSRTGYTLETQYKPFYKVPKDNLDKQNEAISIFALLNACKQFLPSF